MALNTNRTNVDFSFRHVEQVDKLGQSVGGVVATVQSLLDSRAEDNLTDVNNVKNTMRSVAVGDSGAKNIGASIYSDIVGVTVQAQLEEINNKSATAFPVQDGSLGDVKLSNTAGQTKDVVSGHTAQLADNAISVKTFGAKGDGVTDDTTSIQNAVNYAQLNKKSIYFPSGIYDINNPITLSRDRISITGENFYNTVIQAGSAMESVFLFADVSQNTGFTFSNFCIDGGDFANNGISSAKIDHLLLFRVRVIRTLLAGIKIGFGWSNDIVECMIQNNGGNGVEIFASANNAVNFTNTKIFANNGIGVLVFSGYNISFSGCTIEANKICGVYSQFGVSGLSIKQTYFENNGEVGMGFTVPVVTNIKADVIINGANVADRFSYAFPNKQVTLDGNTHQMNVNATCAYYLIGAEGCSIKNNTKEAGTAPMIGGMVYGNYTKVDNLDIGNNNWDNEVFGITNLSQGNQFNAYNWHYKNAEKINFLDNNFIGWAQVLAGASATIARGPESFEGFDTAKITLTANGTSLSLGITIDIDANPELADKDVYISAMMKQSALSMNATTYLSTSGKSSDFNSSNLGWKRITHMARTPLSGLFKAGFGTRSGIIGDSVLIAKPVLGFLGADSFGMYDKIAQPLYKGTSAPIGGTWKKGDRIINSNPTVGQPKAWACTVAGTPGTWVSEGNL